MKSNIANRIKSARLMSGLSLQEVADVIGISKQAINKYEKGTAVPESSKLISLARLFNVNVDYFFRNYSVNIEDVSFRKKAAFGSKKQKALKEEIKQILENYLWIEGLLGIDYDFENEISNVIVNNVHDAVKAAKKIREIWNIGVDPLHNIVQLLEDKEIKVIELKTDEKFDGLATFADEKYPVIVINANFPLERKRFTLLHELGHILMNIPEGSEQEVEKYCDSFASELLLPIEILDEEFGKKRKHINFPELASIQSKYGISIMAILYRLVEAGIIPKEKQTKYYKLINFNPDLKKFVNESRFESPEKSNRFERLIYRALAQELISVSKAASMLNKDINAILDEISILE
jgi:Zn-dependent peptidase ImmA (M78 family)/DNA-binding XRE family transcriptional regulator